MSEVPEGMHQEMLPEQVPSPCISVCVLDPAAGICAGCFRTLDEIAAWSVLDVAAKREVLAALPGRRAKFGAGNRHRPPDVPPAA